MNERIKLLADQATSILDVKHEGYRGNVYTEQVEFFDKEKFAELIVRDVLDEVLQAMDDGMDVYDTVAGKFGVEQ